jgi:glycosyltransferase involved in cell wall biosynthesis
VGLRAVAERDLLVGEGAEGFAAQVVRMLRDPELRTRLAGNARELVRDVYAWERTVDVLESVYDRARAGRNTPALSGAVQVGSES